MTKILKLDKVCILFTLCIFMALATTSQALEDEYNPDDENCLKYTGSICSEIVEPDDCTTEYLTRDSKGRVISTNNYEHTLEKNGVLEKTESRSGCYGHFSKKRQYYFNNDLELDDINCSQIFEIWKDLNRKLGRKDKEGYTGFEKCLPYDPESFSRNCSEKNIVAKTQSESSCYLSQDVFTTSADLTLEYSDIDGYKFVIYENTLTTY